MKHLQHERWAPASGRPLHTMAFRRAAPAARLCLLVAILLGAALGCQSTERKHMGYFFRASPPDVAVTDARITEQTTDGARIEIELTLANPNDIPIRLTRVQYTVRVAGGGSFTYTDVPPISLPASGFGRMTLAAALEHGGGDLQGAAYALDGSLTYEWDSDFRRLLNESQYPLPSVALRQEGDLH